MAAGYRMAADIRLPSGYPAGKTGGQLKMKKKERMSLKEKTQLKWGYFFIAPAIIGLVCFNFGPMLFSMWLSFTKWDVITPQAVSYTHLDVYKRQLSGAILKAIFSSDLSMEILNSQCYNN